MDIKYYNSKKEMIKNIILYFLLLSSLPVLAQTNNLQVENIKYEDQLDSLMKLIIVQKGKEKIDMLDGCVECKRVIVRGLVIKIIDDEGKDDCDGTFNIDLDDESVRKLKEIVKNKHINTDGLRTIDTLHIEVLCVKDTCDHYHKKFDYDFVPKPERGQRVEITGRLIMDKNCGRDKESGKKYCPQLEIHPVYYIEYLEK